MPFRKQEADEKGGDYEGEKGIGGSAARAGVERLRALESFKRITAPFDGVVTFGAPDRYWRPDQRRARCRA